MCTLMLAYRLVQGAPIVALANRDEMLGRPSIRPHRLASNSSVFCGLDAREGGTWCGIHAAGLLVALTNFTVRAPDPVRRSRGLLCLDLLTAGGWEPARTLVRSLVPSTYNPCQLVIAGVHGALRVRVDESVAWRALGTGVHVVTNWPDAPGTASKRARVQARAEAAVRQHRSLDALLSELQQVAREHVEQGDPRHSMCCHAPGYGTRSSSVIALGPRGQVLRYLHCEGAPCANDFHDLTRDASAVGELQ